MAKIEAPPATPKTPNMGFTKSLHLQLAKLNKKALFHTTKANEYTAAAENVQAAINTLSQKSPSLFEK